MYKKIAQYVSQSVLGMIGVSVYILADTYFISRGFGSDGLAVLNLTLPLYGLIYAIGQMLGLGFAVQYNLERAQGRKADSHFLQAITWAFAFSLPIVLCGAICPDRILMLLGADEALAQMGKQYVRLILCGSPLFMSNYIVTAFARNDHAPALAMTGSICGSFYNIIFDYVFMFPMGLGFTGAAMATVGCPVVSMLICLFHFCGKHNHVGFRFERPRPGLLKRSCAVGMSGFVGEFSNGVTSAVFNFLMLGLAGNLGVAAYGVIANIALVCVCIFNGIAQGMQPLLSSAYGHGEKREVQRLLRAGLVIVMTVAVAFVVIGYGFTAQLVGIFNSAGDAVMAGYAEQGLRLYFLGFLMAGINVMLIAYYSAIGEAKPVMVGSLLRGLLLITTFAVVLGEAFGMKGVWSSFLSAELGTFLVLTVMWRMKVRRKKEPESA